ncbi:transmembrane protein, putative, partial [Bodo saltans]
TVPLHPAETDLTKSEDVRVAFRSSVEARTVGNSALRKFIRHQTESQIDLVEAAVEGSRLGGLKVDDKTSELLLLRLVEAGRVKKALELHTAMTSKHMAPTSVAYNILMKMCLDRGMPGSVESLFDDMNKRGRHPNAESYELVIAALAVETPPKWEKAIAIFDNITARSNDRSAPVNKINGRTYNALMRVYLNMSPFDWRVVYNCYYELRQLHPKIPLTWESYELVREAFLKGRAGRFRRILTYVDAWFVLTHIKTVEFWAGVLCFVFAMMGIKGALGVAVSTWSSNKSESNKEKAAAMPSTLS